MAETIARGAAQRAILDGFRRSGASEWIGLGGASMRPIVPAGSRALVDFGDRQPRVGAVVLADVNGRFLVHRVIAAPTPARPDRILLKGDAEPYADPRLTPDAVYGTVRAIQRPNGRVSGAGLHGRRAHLIAIVSRLSSRGLRAATRALTPLPPGGRRSIGRALATLAGAPVLILAITPRRGGPIAIQSKGGEPDAV